MSYQTAGSAFLLVKNEQYTISFYINKLILPQVYDAPHVSSKPSRCSAVGLILAYKDRMWDRQQTDERSVLQEFKNFRLVRQTSVEYTEIEIRFCVIGR